MLSGSRLILIFRTPILCHYKFLESFFSSSLRTSDQTHTLIELLRDRFNIDDSRFTLRSPLSVELLGHLPFLPSSQEHETLKESDLNRRLKRKRFNGHSHSKRTIVIELCSQKIMIDQSSIKFTIVRSIHRHRQRFYCPP